MDEHAFDFTIRVISAVAFGGLNGKLEDYFFSQQLTTDIKAMFKTVMERTVIPLPDIAWSIRSLVVGDKGLAADRRFNAHCLQVQTIIAHTLIKPIHHHLPHHTYPYSNLPSSSIK